MADESVLVAGILEEIGRKESRLTHRKRDENGEFAEYVYEGVFQIIVRAFVSSWASSPIRTRMGPWRLVRIGHRVVHGGEAFREPTLIDDEVTSTVKDMFPFGAAP